MTRGHVMLMATSVALIVAAPALSQSGGGYALIGGVVECEDAAIRGGSLELHGTWCAEARTALEPGPGQLRSPLTGPAATSDSPGVIELELSVVHRSPSVSAVDPGADVNDVEVVGIDDLVQLLEAWGTGPGGPADLDKDGHVGPGDLMNLVARWGEGP